MPLLELRGVAARYGALQALRGIDLSVDEGEIVAVLGANGAGKTTTLRAISATVKTSGDLVFAGERELLLLAAAQRSRGLPAALGEDRETLERTVVVGLDPCPVAANVGAEPEVFVDRKLRERPAALGHVCDPSAGDRFGPPGKPLACEDEVAARLHRR